jgi:hypothetical protein
MKAEKTVSRNLDCEIKIVRMFSYKDAIFSRMYMNGKFKCYVLESRIYFVKAGIYKAEKYFSLKHNKTLSVVGIKARTGILFHKGFSTKHTKGCFIVGCSIVGDCISDSDVAMYHFQNEIEKYEKFTVEIKIADTYHDTLV